MKARVDHAVTSGTFSLDGQAFDVENNVWVAGDGTECVVLDAPHDVAAILDVIGGRRVLAIVATHAHDDHVRAAPELAAVTGAPVLLHPADLPLWGRLLVLPDEMVVHPATVTAPPSPPRPPPCPTGSPAGIRRAGPGDGEGWGVSCWPGRWPLPVDAVRVPF